MMPYNLGGVWQMSMDFKSTTKAFPGFGKIFCLRESGSRRAFRGGLEVGADTFGLTRAEVHPNESIPVEWEMGSPEPGEVVWTTHAASIIVAESVVSLLKTHGFTGWSLYPVAVQNKQKQIVPGYSGLAVTGRCGGLDHSMSVQVSRIRPAGVFPVWKKAFERAKIRNVKFTPLDQLERSWVI
jgi:hypothetical protein